MDKIDKIGADRLAYACARQVTAGKLDSRSAIADALLDYLRIGHPGGPQSVPEWMAAYEGPAQTKERGTPYTAAEIRVVIATHAMDPYHRDLLRFLLDELESSETDIRKKLHMKSKWLGESEAAREKLCRDLCIYAREELGHIEFESDDAVIEYFLGFDQEEDEG